MGLVSFTAQYIKANEAFTLTHFLSRLTHFECHCLNTHSPSHRFSSVILLNTHKLLPSLSSFLASIQTGSGKTFTITGGAMHYADRGIIPRTLSSIFSEVSKRSDHQYQVRGRREKKMNVKELLWFCPELKFINFVCCGCVPLHGHSQPPSPHVSCDMCNFVCFLCINCMHTGTRVVPRDLQPNRLRPAGP